MIWIHFYLRGQVNFTFNSIGNGQLNQFCVKHKKLCKKYAESHNGTIETLCFTHDKRQLFTGGVDKHLKQWDLGKIFCGKHL